MQKLGMILMMSSARYNMANFLMRYQGICGIIIHFINNSLSHWDIIHLNILEIITQISYITKEITGYAMEFIMKKILSL